MIDMRTIIPPHSCTCVSANPALGPLGDLHIYRSPHAEEAVQGFVFAIHGGSWRNGDQHSYDYLWPRLGATGIALVLGTYRKAPASPFPAALNDLTHALHWLKVHGGSHGLDTSRCVLLGASAGGHLAMLLGASANRTSPPLPHIQGIAQYCGIMDLTAQYAWDRMHQSTMTEDFLQGTPEQKPELYRAASPIHQVHTEMPPVWMAHGTEDALVPAEQSRAMALRLRELKQDVIFHEACGLGHVAKETDGRGEFLDPVQLLFEHDLFRFMQKAMRIAPGI